MVNEELRASAEQYLLRGMNLLALNGKRPIDKQWTNLSAVYYTEDSVNKAIEKGHNLGYRIGHGKLVIDVDPKNGGLKSWINLCNLITDLAWYNTTVQTPSGGFHMYLNLPDLPEGTLLPKQLAEYPGIDFLKEGNQCVIPGSIGANGTQYTFMQGANLDGDACPDKLLTLLTTSPAAVNVIQHKDMEAREAFYEQHGWGIMTAQEMADLLRMLLPQNYREYSRWFSILASCHFATAGDTQAEDVFIEWATLDPEYKDHAGKIARHWASLSKHGSNLGGRPITALTLVHEFKQLGALDKVQFLLSRIGHRLRDNIQFSNVSEEDVAGVAISATGKATSSTTGNGGSGDSGDDDSKKSQHDKYQYWLNELRKYKDHGAIVSDFMARLAESPDLTPGQLDLLFKEIKNITGISLSALKDDYKAHSRGILNFLDNVSDSKNTVTQTMVMVTVIARLGGRPLFMFCQGSFWRWKGTGHWEEEADMSIQQHIMAVMEELGFKGITAGSVSSINRMIQIQIYRPDDVWDRGDTSDSDAELSRKDFSAHLLPMVNMSDGELLLDTITGRWRLQHHNPKNYKRIILPVRHRNVQDLDLEVACPTWLKFMDSAMWTPNEEDTELRKRQLGCAMGYSMQETMPFLKKSFYLIGSPDTGKSVTLDVIEELLGRSNVSSLTLSQLGDKFGPVHLKGSLANISGEIARGELINDGQFKSIISGDSIHVESKGKDGYSIRNKARLFFGGNNLPRSRDKSGAIESRMVFIPYDNACPPDKRDYDLRSKLMKELDGIARWALEIFAEEYMKDKCSSIFNTPSMGAARLMQEWQDDLNPSRIWMRERLLIGGSAPGFTPVDGNWDDLIRQGVDEFVSSQALYADYTEWCKNNGYHAMNAVHLSRALTQFVLELAGSLPRELRDRFLLIVNQSRGYVVNGKSRKQVRGWAGIMFNTPEKTMIENDYQW